MLFSGGLWIFFAVLTKIHLSESNSVCVITPMKMNLTIYPFSANDALNCSFNGVPVDTVNWTRNGQLIKKDFNKTSSAVFLYNRSHDQFVGRFECTAKRGQASISCSANPSKPILQALPSVKIVKIGRNPELECKASGWPTPRLSWWRNGLEIRDGDHYNSYMIRQRDVNILYMGLVAIDEYQHGTHTCRAQNFFGTSVQDIIIMVKRDMFLSDFRDQFPTVGLEGENMTLECICKEDTVNECKKDTAYVYWKFKSHNLNNSARTIISKKVLDNGHVKILMTILNIVKADEGEYLCGINTTLGFGEMQRKLHVLENGFFPRVLATHVDVLAKLHSPATLSCKAVYSNVLTNANTYWKVNNSLIPKSSKHYQQNENGPPYHMHNLENTKGKSFELKILNVSMQDFGCYSCGIKFKGDIFAKETKICLSLQTDETGVKKASQDDGSQNSPLVAISSITAGGIIMGFVIAFVAYRLCRSKRNAGEPFFETKDSGRQFRYDVFVTFSSHDLNWVRKELIPLVEKHKLNYCIHHRDFEIGKPVVDNMAESVYTSRKVLAIMSHNYLSSKFCRGELEMALYRSTEMGDSSVIVMRIDGVDRNKLPKALRNRTFLDYHDFAERKNWEERLIKHLKPPPMDKAPDRNSTKTYSKLKSTEV